jgi:hypothetical protein
VHTSVMASDRPALMLGDHMSVVLNTTIPSSVLKKKDNTISYHRVREGIVARITRFSYIRSEENVSDLLTKPEKLWKIPLFDEEVVISCARDIYQ